MPSPLPPTAPTLGLHLPTQRRWHAAPGTWPGSAPAPDPAPPPGIAPGRAPSPAPAPLPEPAPGPEPQPTPAPTPAPDVQPIVGRAGDAAPAPPHPPGGPQPGAPVQEPPPRPAPVTGPDPPAPPALDVQRVALLVLAVCAAVALAHWASAVFVPLMLSVLAVMALGPAVDRLARWHVPRWLGAGLLIAGTVGALGITAWSLYDGAVQLADTLPVAAQKVRQSLREASTRPSALDSVQQAATQLEQAAVEASTPPPQRRGVQRVVVERPPFNIRDYLWSGTRSLMSALGQLTMVVFLTYFALASGHRVRHKLLRIAGPSLERRKITVGMLDEITGQIQRYLVVQAFTSLLVGVTTWLTFWALGVDNAAVWGAAAAVLHLAPYIGAALVTAGSVLVAFLQFGTLEMAALVALVSVVIHTLIGSLLTPWLTSRTSRLSPVAVFISVLAWGWLWGLWGLLLGIPVMMGVKAVCDRVDDLKPVGELLGH